MVSCFKVCLVAAGQHIYIPVNATSAEDPVRLFAFVGQSGSAYRLVRFNLLVRQGQPTGWAGSIKRSVRVSIEIGSSQPRSWSRSTKRLARIRICQSGSANM